MPVVSVSITQSDGQDRMDSCSWFRIHREVYRADIFSISEMVEISSTYMMM